MTRKSASKMKPVKAVNSDKFLKQPELPPIEETFDNIKQVMVNTAKVQIDIAGRIDNLMNIRNAAYGFYGSETLANKFIMTERIDFFKKIQNVTTEYYEKILEVVESFELAEFLEEDMKDYFEPITPKVEDIKNEDDLFMAFLVFDIIKPWGEKMTQLHHQMLDEQDQRKAVEAEPIDMED